MIAGRTLLGRVIEQARRSIEGLSETRLIVATDDERIVEHAQQHGCAATMTSAAISTGSGRALAAACAETNRPRYVVNLQGDAPFFDRQCVADVVDLLHRRMVDCATPVIRLDWNGLDALRRTKMVEPFSGTTCIVADDGRAIWFSKQIIPAIRDEPAWRRREDWSPIYQHVGIYGYSFDALLRFEEARSDRYEEIEGLEQLRLLSLGLSVHTVTVRPPPIGVGGIDTPHDAARAEELIARYGDPLE